MKIRQLEQATGLDRATIRFYEKEGLIQPQRQENGYREYERSDQDALLKIKLLRQLGISLESIKKLQQGSADFSDTLVRQIQVLEHQAQVTARAKDICRTMINDAVDYNSFNASVYLELMERPHATPAKKTHERPFTEAVAREYHPVKRFLARMLDGLIYNVVIQFIVIVILRIRPYNFFDFLMTYGSQFIRVPINAALLHMFGTTPGKWIMGIRVENADGGHLTFHNAIYREWAVLRYGLGWGIPFWEIYRLYKSYQYYRDIGEPEWDEDNEYIHRSVGSRHIAGAVAIIAAVLVTLGITALDSIKPANRGVNLTVEEFSDNYNYVLTKFQDKADRSNMLQEDGSWPDDLPGNVTIYIGAEPEDPNASFQFETEDGYIRKITYENTWTNVVFPIPSIPDSCQMAMITALMSQKGIHIQAINEFDELLQNELGKSNGHIEIENLEINWTIRCMNCQLDDNGYINAYGNDDSEFSLAFEIYINDTVAK